MQTAASRFDAPMINSSSCPSKIIMIFCCSDPFSGNTYTPRTNLNSVSVFDVVAYPCQLKHSQVSTSHVHQLTRPIVWNHIWTVVLFHSHVDRPLRCHMYANVSAFVPKCIAVIEQGTFGQILLLCPVRPPSLNLLRRFMKSPF